MAKLLGNIFQQWSLNFQLFFVGNRTVYVALSQNKLHCVCVCSHERTCHTGQQCGSLMCL